MSRTLGLDLGTNSIGWAVIDSAHGGGVVAKGVQVFPKGVGEEGGREVSVASERTGYRSARRIKQRRKLRKQNTLKELIHFQFCPEISKKDIDLWKEKKVYPAHPGFVNWLRCVEKLPDGKEGNPYAYRWWVATHHLDLSVPENRYILGRAFYHLAQRRGYKSNRISGEEKDGKVMGAISALHEKMNGRTLGQYYYEDCFGKAPVRGEGHYTSRSDYESEFSAICKKQNLSEEMTDAIRNAIFYQRPLRSQKETVGPCLLEPKKKRVPVSHPAYERFRLLQFLNNVRIRPQGDNVPRMLNMEEREKGIKWLSSLKRTEKFEKLAKKLTPRKASCSFGEKQNEMEIQTWGFNFRKDAGVPESTTTSTLIKLFGEEYPAGIRKIYRKSGGKTDAEIVSDIWHAMYSFDDDNILNEYAREKLGLLDDNQRIEFCKPLKQGYGTLSLAAIRKINPWLEKGLIYSHAVYLANLPTIFRKAGKEWNVHTEEIASDIGQIIATQRENTAIRSAANDLRRHLIQEEVKDLSMYLSEGRNIRQCQSVLGNCIQMELGRNRWANTSEQDQENVISQALEIVKSCWDSEHGTSATVPILNQTARILHYLQEEHGIPESYLEMVYHPSVIETYPDQNEKLASPRIPSIRNPVFMRTMFRLRAIINELIETGVIDSQTRIRVEMARDLNDANQRAAIERFQRMREKMRSEYSKAIEEAGFNPTPTLILKYQLWIEQERRCLYTDQQIGLTEFLGENPAYDIEHTIPRSRRFDDSQTNLTLCSREFNREIKGRKLPQELSSKEELLDRVRKLWWPEVEKYESFCAKNQMAKRSAADKAAKDKALQNLHYNRMWLRYWKDKIRNFETTEVPEGFTNNQLVDTRIICKYAVLYLKSYFDRVYSMKASALHALKEIWGLTDKSRDNHIHHCIDAVVTASIRPSFYQELAAYYHQMDRFEQDGQSRPHPPEPWPGFAQYLNHDIFEDVLVVHHSKNPLLKPTFKKEKLHGKWVIKQGDSARGSLHKETYYGVIKPPAKDGKYSQKELACVVRKKLDSTFKDFDRIVDPVVREKVKEQKDKLKTGDTIWYDESRGIPIRKVRIYDATQPGSLIKLKSHRDISKHEHKRHLGAANESNYLVALYRGKVKGKPKASWKKVSNFEAVQASKHGIWDELLPATTNEGLEVYQILKIGMQIILKKTNDEDLRNLDQPELSRRLYHVTILEGPRTIIRHHQEARPAKDLPRCISSFPWHPSENPPGLLNLASNGLWVAVEGVDFKLTQSGQMIWIDAEP